jgi:Fibronectin type III domain
MARLFRLLVIIALPLSLVLAVCQVASPVAALGSEQPPAKPGPPTNVSAVAENGRAFVTWQRPAGGHGITSYVVTSVPGAKTATVHGGQRSAIVSGLTNGTPYRFYVTAKNHAGTSAPSASSEPVTPAVPTVPSAPVISGILARDSAIELDWSAPTAGTSGLRGYLITVYLGGSKVATEFEPPAATEAIVGGLTNGTAYVFTITAFNRIGASPASLPSPAIAPKPATAPMNPADLQAFPGNHEIQLSWMDPPDGGAVITHFTITLNPGDRTFAIPGNTTVVVLHRLRNGIAYKVSVTASNKAGTSPPATVGPLTPQERIVPGAPQNASASAAGAGVATLQWTPPVTTGTSDVRFYTVTASPGQETVKSGKCAGMPTVCTATMSGLSTTKAYTFTVTATSRAGTGPASAATTAVTPDLVMKQAPVVLSATSVATLSEKRSDGTLLFDQPTAQVTGLRTGQLVQLSPSAADPTGYLGQVTSTGTQGGYFAVYTSPATLADKYRDYQSAMNIPFLATSMKADVPGLHLEQPMVNGKPLSSTAPPDGFSAKILGDSLVLDMSADLLGGDSEEGDSAKPSLEPSGELDGMLTLQPILHFNDQNGFLKLTVGGMITADASAKLGVELKAGDPFPLAVVVGAPVVTEFGTVNPLLYIAAVLNTDGTVGVTFDTNFSAMATATCQIRESAFNSSGDGCKGHASATGSETHGSLYGDMDIKGGFQFGAGLTLDYGILTAGVTLTPEMELDVSTDENPWWSLKVDLDLGYFNDVADIPVFDDDDIVEHDFTLAHASGPFTGLFISPSVQSVPPGGSVTFVAGHVSGPVLTTDWKVIAGPGTVSDGRYTAPRNFTGTAVLEATFDGETARAAVEVRGMLPPVVDSGTRGLVDALVVSWKPPAANSTPPDDYEVTALKVTGPTSAPGIVRTTVPAPETYAYLPNLPAGTRYKIFVTGIAGNIRVGSASAPGTSAPTVIVLDRLPSELGGTGFNGDIATSDFEPDKLGTAGTGGAVVSGDGQYAFFYTEGRSDLAPPAVFGTDNENTYLVRENLASKQIVLASIGANGKPVTARPAEQAGGTDHDPGLTGALVTNSTGTAVGFTTGSGQSLVYNFLTGKTFTVSSPKSTAALAGISTSTSGTTTTVAYVTFTSGAKPIASLYRQTQGHAPKLIGTCDCTTSVLPSMSGNGNLIAYVPPPSSSTAPLSVWVYHANTGKSSNLFPVNTKDRQSLLSPVISFDGTRIAVEVAALCPGSCQPGIAIKTLTSKGTSTTITKADVHVRATTGITDVPVSLSNGGTALAYALFNSATGASRFQVFRGGGSVIVPALSTTYPETAQLPVAGSEVIYTLALRDTNYPGVFEWALG